MRFLFIFRYLADGNQDLVRIKESIRIRCSKLESKDIGVFRISILFACGFRYDKRGFALIGVTDRDLLSIGLCPGIDQHVIRIVPS